MFCEWKSIMGKTSGKEAEQTRSPIKGIQGLQNLNKIYRIYTHCDSISLYIFTEIVTPYPDTVNMRFNNPCLC